MTTPTFTQFLLIGNAKSTDPVADSAKFLQGQITANIQKIDDNFLPTAICNLKGRILFGLWLKKAENGFHIVLHDDLAENFENHVKKYGAFSKVALTEKQAIFPTVIDDKPTFTLDNSLADVENWQKISIAQGNYWITADNSELFQPQELRLHQRGGVDYDKGCYMGQEIIARLWFKASPKAWLHRVHLNDKASVGEKIDKSQVVNIIPDGNAWQALVVGSPESVASVGDVLSLPDALSGDVARAK